MSVEFSPSNTRRVSSFQPEIPEEPKTSLEGSGRSIEFSKGQAIVFPSSQLLPVQYPTENVGQDEAEGINNNSRDSGQIANNKIDSISKSSIRESSSRSLAPEQSNTTAEISKPEQKQKMDGGSMEVTSELDPTFSNDPKQGINSGPEFDSNLVDDDARVAPQILAADIPSYQPSYPNRDPKPKDKKGSPVSSSATSSSNPEDSSPKDNLTTRSVVESRLVVVVGTLTVLAVVLVLLVMLLLCRYIDIFCPLSHLSPYMSSLVTFST